MASVNLNNIKKTYGYLTVIPELNLHISEGEFIALVGPSGCGKSTLLRIIAGLEKINGGDIIINGRNVNHITPKNRNIAMVFQSYALYPQMTVRQNISFNLKLAGHSKSIINEKVSEVAKMLDLEALLDRKPGQLSGGQRQRVAMGRAIVRNPDVFLFDEPLSNLDAKLRVSMRSEIKKLHQKVKTTSIYVTHDQIEAMTLADRLVVLNKGQIEQVGTPLELYTRPDNLFVASFIGSPSMNFLHATIERQQNNSYAVFEDGNKLPLHNTLDNDMKTIVGIRPEHLTITPNGPIAGTIEMIEPTGSQTIIYAKYGGILMACVTAGDKIFHLGDTVTMQIDEDKIHLFNPNTRQRLD